MDKVTVEKLLTTTRSVRKRLDLTRPVPLEVIERCLEIAIQAPTGSNMQGWRFLVITDPEKRRVIADHYRRSFASYARESVQNTPRRPADDPRTERMGKVVDSATYLARHMADVPVLIIACLEGRVETESPMVQAGFYGSILPAAWSLMLALRAEGMGTAWTTLHLQHEKEVGELLGIPDTFTQTVLFPVAYFTGEDFKAAKRVPVRELTYLDSWNQPLP